MIYNFDKKELLIKFVEFSRYFEPRVQVMDGSNFYKVKTVDSEQIFMMELGVFNPDNV